MDLPRMWQSEGLEFNGQFDILRAGETALDTFKSNHTW